MFCAGNLSNTTRIPPTGNGSEKKGENHSRGQQIMGKSVKKDIYPFRGPLQSVLSRYVELVSYLKKVETSFPMAA